MVFLAFNLILFEKYNSCFQLSSFIVCLLVSLMSDHISIYWRSKYVQPSVFWALKFAFSGFFITVSTPFSRKIFVNFISVFVVLSLVK